MAAKRKSRGAKARHAATDGQGSPPAPLSAQVVRRILGPLDDAQVCRVLELGAGEAELQQAAAALAAYGATRVIPGHGAAFEPAILERTVSALAQH